MTLLRPFRPRKGNEKEHGTLSYITQVSNTTTYTYGETYDYCDAHTGKCWGKGGGGYMLSVLGV